MKLKLKLLGILSLALIWSNVLLAAEPITVPNTFSNGQVADADEINANFQTLLDQINVNLAEVEKNSKRGVLQVGHAFTNEFLAIPNTFPWNDALPQITQGGEVTRLTFTPQSSSSLLIIEANAHAVEQTNSGNHLNLALFTDSSNDAIAASSMDQYGDFGGYSGRVHNLLIRHVIENTSNSPITFILKAGGDGGTININGGAGSRKLGGAFHSGFTVTEIAN